MKKESLIIQCFEHSDFVSALYSPKEFNFKKEANKSDHYYKDILLTTQITLEDISLIEGKPFRLSGQFLIIEDKKDCCSGNYHDIPDSSVCILLRGTYDTSITIEGETINMISEFDGAGYQYGTNKDNNSFHKPLYSEMALHGTELNVSGEVIEVFKLSNGKCVKTSSISGDVGVFDLNEEKDLVFERSLKSRYSKGLITRGCVEVKKLSAANIQASHIAQDDEVDTYYYHDAVDCRYREEKRKEDNKKSKKGNLSIAINFQSKKEQERKEQLEEERNRAYKKYSKKKSSNKMRGY